MTPRTRVRVDGSSHRLGGAGVARARYNRATAAARTAQAQSGKPTHISERTMIDISRDNQSSDADGDDANRDPLTGAPGAHPVGTGLGTAGGVGAGMAIGALGGPLGAGVGAVIGGVAGGLVGKEAGEAVNPTNPEDFIGCVVIDRDNDRIGTVESVWHDADGQPSFLAVKTGWLGMGRAHLVPAEAAEWAPKGRRIRLPFDDDVVKDAPSFASEEDLDDAGEMRIYDYWRRFGLSGHAASTPAPIESAPVAAGSGEAHTIPLREETLEVGKREVQAGGVRIRKVVRTRTLQQPVELRHEEVVIERVPGGGTALAEDEGTIGEDEVFIPLRREEPMLAKRTSVREEVRVGTREEVEREQIAGTVRSEDVEIVDERVDPRH